jgi:DNA polymerase-3 subunit epsilon
LNDVLEDRVVEDHEGDQLVDLAVNWGLSVDRVSALHQEYLHRLVKTACLDDKVTSQEQADILQVARLLGFPDFTYDDLEQTVEHVYSDPAQEGLDTDTSQFTGKTVCFTGMSICRKNGQFISRDRAAEIAGINGMAVLKTVTKKLDILVVADPNSQSGKASKARRYGTRIIHEPEFWRLLSIEID